MKILSVFIFVLFISSLCFAESYDEDQIIDYDDGKIFRQTRTALLSYSFVQEKTQYWGRRLEKALIGEYAEKLLFIAPLVSGKIEFNAYDLNFYVDARAEKSGVRYVYQF